MKTITYNFKELKFTEKKVKDSVSENKAFSSSVLEIEGFASTDFRDRVKDIVEPEAFESSIKRFSTNPILLLNHDQDRPIGGVQEIRITDDGLFIKGFVSASEPKVQQLIREGVLRAFSIGFNPKTANFDASREANIISDLELLEISIVSVPCNPMALFQTTSEYDEDLASKFLNGYVTLQAVLKEKTYNISELSEIICQELDLDKEQFSSFCKELELRGFQVKEMDKLIAKIYQKVEQVNKSAETSKVPAEEKKEIEVESEAVTQETKSEENSILKATEALLALMGALNEKLDKLISIEESKNVPTEETKCEEKQREEDEELEEDKKTQEKEKEVLAEEEKSSDSEEDEDKESKTKAFDIEEIKSLEDLEAEIQAMELEALENEIKQLED